MANSLLQWNSPMEMGGASGNPDGEVKISQQGHETVKQRVRKSGKSSASSQKKLPQRGLGVAQLERLRLQERWKKMTELNQVHQPPLSINNDHHQYQFPFPFADHQNGVSIPYSRFGPGGFTNDPLLSTSHMQTQTHPFRFANGVFPGNGAGTFCGGRPVFPDQFQMDRMRVATQESRFHGENLHLHQASKELSSTQTQNQMLHCSSDQCDICKKIKHIHGGNLGLNYNMATRKYPETVPSSVEDKTDFQGWDLGSNRPINRDQRRDMGLNLANFSVHEDVHEESEVVAVHHQGKSVGGGALMEYNFFPQRTDRSTTSSTTNTGGCDFFLAGVAAAGAAGEASCTTRNTTNSLDLSLKLSC